MIFSAWNCDGAGTVKLTGARVEERRDDEG